MEDYRIMHILQNMDNIGASPAVSLRLFRMVEWPDFDINELVKLIMQEPVICAQILKVSNSVYYARGNRINNISQAVMHLGINTVKKILFAIELIGLYKCNYSLSKFNESEFWKHTIAGAMICQEIGNHIDFINNDACFLTGILRNIGVLIIQQYFPDKFIEIYDYCEKNKVSFKKAEEKVLHINHREIGYLIGVRWNLPDIIIFSIKGIANNRKDIKKISDFLEISDAILADKNYATWDKYYSPIMKDELKDEYKLNDSYITNICDSIFTEVNELSRQIFFSYS